MADMADDDREGNGAGDSGLIEQIQARIPRVEAALKAGRLAEALRLSLEDPPLSTKDSSIKDKNAEVVMKALIACSQRDDQLQLFLTTMLSGGDIADNLMKYIYRGLKQPDNSALLLKMHEKVLAAAGQGCLVRALMDRRVA